MESWDGGDQYLYDPFNPDARKAVFQKFMEGYGKYGIKTIWIDAAEPERMDDKNVGNWRFHLGTDAEIGGAWVQQHTRMIADGMLSIGIKPEDYFVRFRIGLVLHPESEANVATCCRFCLGMHGQERGSTLLPYGLVTLCQLLMNSKCK